MIVDKALQGALLVLENNIVIKRCNVIQKQKDVLQDENETLRKQIQILQKEAEKLNGKLNETSSSLCDVMKSKEQLEDDLSSVFQLHNMRNIERKIQKENDGKLDMSTILQENVTTLLENNTKLQEKLQVSENDKENLKSELTSVKVSGMTFCNLIFFYNIKWSTSLLETSSSSPVYNQRSSTLPILMP